jgi:uncharacterized protein involved in exopolysaccharide biosynthesis
LERAARRGGGKDNDPRTLISWGFHAHLPRKTPEQALVTVHQQSELDRGFTFVLRHKLSIFVLAVVGGALGVGLSFLFTPEFKADAVLIPSDETLGLNANSALGGLGGLASLVGVGVNANKNSEAVETLKSRGLAVSYMEANGILPILFPDKWDPVAKKWSAASGHIPTLEDGYRIFDKNVRTVIEDRKTGLVTISIVWSDPVLAKKWTEGLIDAANDLLRVQATDRSSRNLEYLKKATDGTSIMEVKATIYKLMETEIKKQMIAYGSKDYAFRVVDPPVIPEHKVSPKRSNYLLIGAVLFPLLWFGFAALWNLNAKMNRAD